MGRLSERKKEKNTKNSYFTLCKEILSHQHNMRMRSKTPDCFFLDDDFFFLLQQLFFLFLCFSFSSQSSLSLFLFMSMLLLSNTLIRCARLDFFFLPGLSMDSLVFFLALAIILSCWWIVAFPALFLVRHAGSTTTKKCGTNIHFFACWKTKVISLWHKWPARSVDRRRILITKSLCLFVSSLQVKTTYKMHTE